MAIALSDLLSLFSVYGLRVFLSLIVGCVTHRFWSKNPHGIARTKLQKLGSVMVIPATRLNAEHFNERDRLVIIEKGCVIPLSEISDLVTDPPFDTQTGKAVLVMTTEYTNEPKEFEDVFKGTRHVEVSRVPFAIHSEKKFVVVRKVDPDHLPLTHELTEKFDLDPAMTLTHRVVNRYEGQDKKYKERVASSVIQVQKVREKRVLKTEVELENVFGIMNKVDEILVIEPSPDFPKKCFNMGRAEIERVIVEEAYADAYRFRCWSLLFGFVFLGLLYGFRY